MSPVDWLYDKFGHAIVEFKIFLLIVNARRKSIWKTKIGITGFILELNIEKASHWLRGRTLSCYKVIVKPFLTVEKHSWSSQTHTNEWYFPQSCFDPPLV